MDYSQQIAQDLRDIKRELAKANDIALTRLQLEHMQWRQTIPVELADHDRLVANQMGRRLDKLCKENTI